jgi:hypothetical protein
MAIMAAVCIVLMCFGMGMAHKHGSHEDGPNSDAVSSCTSATAVQPANPGSEPVHQVGAESE